LQARRIGTLVAIVVGLLLTLRLLGGLRRGAVVLVLSHPAGRGPHAGAHGRALAGISTDGAADRSDRGAARRASHPAALLRRRCAPRLSPRRPAVAAVPRPSAAAGRGRSRSAAWPSCGSRTGPSQRPPGSAPAWETRTVRPDPRPRAPPRQVRRRSPNDSSC